MKSQPFIEEGQFAQAHFQSVIIEARILENLRVGFEGDERAGALGSADVFDFGNGLAAGIFLFVDPAITTYFSFGPFAQGRHGFGPHAVQTHRHLIGVFIKFGAGACQGHDDFQRRAFHHRMLIDRNTAAVVFDTDTAVFIDFHLNMMAVAGHRFIHTVIYQLIDQMMQPIGTDVANVHTRPLANVVGVLQDLHIFAAVIAAACQLGLLSGNDFIFSQNNIFFVHRCVLTKYVLVRPLRLQGMPLRARRTARSVFIPELLRGSAGRSGGCRAVDGAAVPASAACGNEPTLATTRHYQQSPPTRRAAKRPDANGQQIPALQPRPRLSPGAAVLDADPSHAPRTAGSGSPPAVLVLALVHRAVWPY